MASTSSGRLYSLDDVVAEMMEDVDHEELSDDDFEGYIDDDNEQSQQRRMLQTSTSVGSVR